MNRITPALAFLLCALLSTQSTHAQDLNKVIIDLELKDASLAEAFTKIESLTSFRFTYKTEDIAGVKGISFRLRQVSLKKVLTELLGRTPLHYEQSKLYILIKKIPGHSSRGLTLYGFVTSGQSGETLTGATISISGEKTYFTTTNTYGFYSLTAPAGTYQLNCSYIGLAEYDKKLDLQETSRNNIELAGKEHNDLQTVIVATASNKSNIRRPITGSHRLDIAEIKKIAMAGGEPDVLKSLQFLPGIQTSNEGTTNVSVRGGSYDQNLVLLDEAPVYNPTHTLGFFSAFNTDAIKDVAIYKGVFPTQYGGRLSSVVDVRMKEGNSKEQSVSGGVGLLASRLTWEGPIKKDKSSFMVSGRYSNIGALLNLSKNFHFLNFHTTNSSVAFYDLNAKFNPILGDKDRLYLSGYTGHDNFFLDLIDGSRRMKWGNTTISARWNHVSNPSFFANTSLLYSNYRSSNINLAAGGSYELQGRLREITLKTDMEWMMDPKNLIRFGGGITGQEISPGNIVPIDTNAVAKGVSLKDRRSAQLFAYISNEQRLGKWLSLSYGVRATGFATLGDAMVYRYNADTTAVIDSVHYGKGKIVKAYFGAEPRITARLLLTNTTSLKLSYGRNYQFQHLLTNASVGLPTDIWIPSDAYFKPQYSDQVAAGGYKTFRDGTYEGSVELYYRKSHNIIDFRDNAEIFLNEKIETQVLTGQAKGYGLEFLLKKNKGASNGWISYTYSRSLRQINGVNKNEWYPANYDHRHNLSLVYNQSVSKRLSFSANWVFRTGGRTTIPEGSYVFNGNRFMYYSSRNGYTMPSYHRLDLSVTLQGRRNDKRKWQGEWVLSVYNVYNRKNVFAIYTRQDEIDFTDVKASMVYLVGALPTITYNFKF
ncbi:TonB-dependent receptor plug domain-containing protein [Flavitalea sp. BT771]|uniref:TonB-dependent receptor n=1 Tax=Flavitalea sp. BT771 TaxID=3063329 RepID=UPI0026E2923E|nr:carboxypeptidase-like regulatory domain-containing protein [Flavitalea sp. BT771]MDO6429357.1 TonB-dependent receptor plug domain-containing protein [Flavitalea sp. BT771]MDV6218515.1 TonB-dependent receptor plug domain-containing protein [Flavitalea sp. BT771]